MTLGDQLDAVFRPTRIDTLAAPNQQYIGQRFLFHWCWEITEEDGGPYVGQSAWIYYGDLVGGADGPRGWVPDEDLEEIA